MGTEGLSLGLYAPSLRQTEALRWAVEEHLARLVVSQPSETARLAMPSQQRATATMPRRDGSAAQAVQSGARRARSAGREDQTATGDRTAPVEETLGCVGPACAARGLNGQTAAVEPTRQAERGPVCAPVQSGQRRCPQSHCPSQRPRRTTQPMQRCLRQLAKAAAQRRNPARVQEEWRGDRASAQRGRETMA